MYFVFVDAAAMFMPTVFVIYTLSVSFGQKLSSAVPSTVSVPDAETTVSSVSRTEVYLNPTMPYGSPLNLSVVLDLSLIHI